MHSNQPVSFCPSFLVSCSGQAPPPRTNSTAQLSKPAGCCAHPLSPASDSRHQLDQHPLGARMGGQSHLSLSFGVGLGFGHFISNAARQQGARARAQRSEYEGDKQNSGHHTQPAPAPLPLSTHASSPWHNAARVHNHNQRQAVALHPAQFRQPVSHQRLRYTTILLPDQAGHERRWTSCEYLTRRRRRRRYFLLSSPQLVRLAFVLPCTALCLHPSFWPGVLTPTDTLFLSPSLLLLQTSEHCAPSPSPFLAPPRSQPNPHPRAPVSSPILPSSPPTLPRFMTTRHPPSECTTFSGTSDQSFGLRCGPPRQPGTQRII